ncbi:hypothetical protein STVA_13030 [Allostella vacuolata]|nr:hypothetical protein STVA_13030 [Stella vacuolata]
MESLIADVGDFITANQLWAGPLLGLIVFGESLAVVGLLVPATALMLVTGGLIATGTLDPWLVLPWSVGGAIIGDALSYYVGRWMGPSIMRRWPLNHHRHSVARARLFFRRYGTASIFFGRFLGPIRSTIPLVAGTMLMSNRKFQFANVTSAVVWVPVMLAPGYAAAKGLGDLHSIHDSGWILLGLGIVVATVIATWIGFRILRGQPRRRSRRTA